MTIQTVSDIQNGITRYDNAPQAWLSRWAVISFVLMFPGYIIYHYGVNLDWWAATFGGLFGPAAILTATAVPAVLANRNFNNKDLQTLRFLIFGLIGYMLMWSLINWFFISENSLSDEIMTEALSTVVVFVAMIFIGAFFPLNRMAIQRISLISLSLAFFCIIHAYITIGFPNGPLTAFSSGEEGSFATYQGVGRSMLVIALIAACGARSYSIVSLSVMVTTAFVILTLGSRAHFFVLVIAIFVQLIILIAKANSRGLGAIFVIFALAVALTGTQFFFESRASEVFDLRGSNSWILRQAAMDEALQVISNNPMIGNFGYHIGNYSGYAHNMLSAWTQYGGPGFLIFASSMLYSTYVSLKGLILTNANEPAWLLAFQFNLAGILLAVAFEPIMLSVFPALGWGFAIRAIIMSHARKFS